MGYQIWRVWGSDQRQESWPPHRRWLPVDQQFGLWVVGRIHPLP